MSTRTFFRDVGIGLASGQAGNLVMDRVTTILQEKEPQLAKEQEAKVSPGISYNIAARQLSERAGLHLSDEQVSRLGSVFHTGLGLAGGELYVLLRRVTSMRPVPAALTMSMVLFLGVDEGLTPLMGWSTPPNAYPLATHLRGLIGHLSLGATVALTAEALSWLAGCD
ncbi:MAG TPA: DUF1440 domain-containing protein [Chloroflexota bacterium]